MALSVTSNANALFSTATSGTITLPSANANDIVVLVVCANRTPAQGALTEVSHVSSTHLGSSAWYRRAQIQQSDSLAYNGSGQAYNDLELIWAYTSSALTSEVITISTDAVVDDASIVVFSVGGFSGTSYHTNPWDGNSSVPATLAQDSSSTAPSIGSISTTDAAPMVIGCIGLNSSSSSSPTAASGYTAIDFNYNGGGTDYSAAYAQEQVFSSAQSGITVAATNSFTAWMMIADALASAGGPGGGGGTALYNPAVAISDGLISAERIAPAYGVTVVSGAIQLAESLSRAYRAGAIVSELIRLTEIITPKGVFKSSISELAALADALIRASKATITEGALIAETFKIARAAAILEALLLGETTAPLAHFHMAVAEALLGGEALARFLGLSITEGVILSDPKTPLWRFARGVSEGIIGSETITPSLLVSLTAADGLVLADADVLKMIWSGKIVEGMSVNVGYVSPSGNFTAWAINTRTAAVTEYQNYNFVSFTQAGHKYLGANAQGLYELDGDTDAGKSIVADILSGFMQIGGSRFTSFKAAYLGLRTDLGQFILKLIAGDGRVYVYAVNGRDMQTTRVNLGKGLRSRYFRFELQNTDGADFDLDDFELIPLIAQRRI